MMLSMPTEICLNTIGPLNEVPEEYLDKHFRPIEIIKDSEYKIHLIIN